MRTSSSRLWEAGHSCSGSAVLSSAGTARNPGADNTCDRQQIQWERSSCVQLITTICRDVPLTLLLLTLWAARKPNKMESS